MTRSNCYGAGDSTKRQVPTEPGGRDAQDDDGALIATFGFTGRKGTKDTKTSVRRTAPIEVAGVLVATAAVLLVVVACSGGSDEADEPPSTSATSTTETVVTSTTTTQPPAAGATRDDAFIAVREVVAEATGLVDKLFQDPQLVDNPANDDLDRLRQLYTPGSRTPDGVEAQLHDLADQGLRMQPAEGVFRDLGVYQLSAVDADTVRFRVCATEDQETVDADGHVVDVLAQVTQGDGEAHRIDGVWRLDHIEPRDDLTLAFAPGSADPGFCDEAYGEEGTP